MKTFENILLIYPSDPTIQFLKPIESLIINRFPNCIIQKPQYKSSLYSMINDDTELIFFLGHGNTNGLFGGTNDNGEKELLCDIATSSLLLQDCSVILFSCNSKDFLKKLEYSQIKNYIVFGDMPTDFEHIKYNQNNRNKEYWTECNFQQMNYYISTITEAALKGFEKVYNTNSFYGFKKGVEHVVNMKINEIINNNDWTKTQKLQLIERIVEFKNDIKCNESIVTS